MIPLRHVQSSFEVLVLCSHFSNPSGIWLLTSLFDGQWYFPVLPCTLFPVFCHDTSSRPTNQCPTTNLVFTHPPSTTSFHSTLRCLSVHASLVFPRNSAWIGSEQGVPRRPLDAKVMGFTHDLSCKPLTCFHLSTFQRSASTTPSAAPFFPFRPKEHGHGGQLLLNPHEMFTSRKRDNETDSPSASSTSTFPQARCQLLVLATLWQGPGPSSATSSHQSSCSSSERREATWQWKEIMCAVFQSNFILSDGGGTSALQLQVLIGNNSISTSFLTPCCMHTSGCAFPSFPCPSESTFS